MTLVELDVYNQETRKRTEALGALVFYLQIEISTFLFENHDKPSGFTTYILLSKLSVFSREISYVFY